MGGAILLFRTLPRCTGYQDVYADERQRSRAWIAVDDDDSRRLWARILRRGIGQREEDKGDGLFRVNIERAAKEFLRRRGEGGENEKRNDYAGEINV